MILYDNAFVPIVFLRLVLREGGLVLLVPAERVLWPPVLPREGWTPRIALASVSPTGGSVLRSSVLPSGLRVSRIGWMLWSSVLPTGELPSVSPTDGSGLRSSVLRSVFRLF